MKVGEEFDVKILGLSQEFGLARIGQFIVYVRNGEVGELLRVKVTDVNDNIVYADVIGELEVRLPRSSQVEEDEDDHSYPDDVLDQFYSGK